VRDAVVQKMGRHLREQFVEGRLIISAQRASHPVPSDQSD
jgi:hypothetical protein